MYHVEIIIWNITDMINVKNGTIGISYIDTTSILLHCIDKAVVKSY